LAQKGLKSGNRSRVPIRVQLELTFAAADIRMSGMQLRIQPVDASQWKLR
jgi:hypothetical protein